MGENLGLRDRFPSRTSSTALAKSYCLASTCRATALPMRMAGPTGNTNSTGKINSGCRVQFAAPGNRAITTDPTILGAMIAKLTPATHPATLPLPDDTLLGVDDFEAIDECEDMRTSAWVLSVARSFCSHFTRANPAHAVIAIPQKNWFQPAACDLKPCESLTPPASNKQIAQMMPKTVQKMPTHAHAPAMPSSSGATLRLSIDRRIPLPTRNIANKGANMNPRPIPTRSSLPLPPPTPPPLDRSYPAYQDCFSEVGWTSTVTVRPTLWSARSQKLARRPASAPSRNAASCTSARCSFVKSEL